MVWILARGSLKETDYWISGEAHRSFQGTPTHGLLWIWKRKPSPHCHPTRPHSTPAHPTPPRPRPAPPRPAPPRPAPPRPGSCWLQGGRPSTPSETGLQATRVGSERRLGIRGEVETLHDACADEPRHHAGENTPTPVFVLFFFPPQCPRFVFPFSQVPPKIGSPRRPQSRKPLGFGRLPFAVQKKNLKGGKPERRKINHNNRVFQFLQRKQNTKPHNNCLFPFFQSPKYCLRSRGCGLLVGLSWAMCLVRVGLTSCSSRGTSFAIIFRFQVH